MKNERSETNDEDKHIKGNQIITTEQGKSYKTVEEQELKIPVYSIAEVKNDGIKKLPSDFPDHQQT